MTKFRQFPRVVTEIYWGKKELSALSLSRRSRYQPARRQAGSVYRDRREMEWDKGERPLHIKWARPPRPPIRIGLYIRPSSALHNVFWRPPPPPRSREPMRARCVPEANAADAVCGHCGHLLKYAKKPCSPSPSPTSSSCSVSRMRGMPASDQMRELFPLKADCNCISSLGERGGERGV